MARFESILNFRPQCWIRHFEFLIITSNSCSATKKDSTADVSLQSSPDFFGTQTVKSFFPLKGLIRIYVRLIQILKINVFCLLSQSHLQWDDKLPSHRKFTCLITEYRCATRARRCVHAGTEMRRGGASVCLCRSLGRARLFGIDRERTRSPCEFSLRWCVCARDEARVSVQRVRAQRFYLCEEIARTHVREARVRRGWPAVLF